MVIAEVTVVPIGTESASISSYVAECHELLQEQDRVEYELTPMGTVLEGKLSDILDLVEKLHEVPFASGAPRVSTTLKIDERTDREANREQKIESVQNKLNED